MGIGITLLVVGALVALIYVVIEFKRFKHKIFAFALIGLIVFTYFSFSIVVKKHDLDLGSASGIVDAGKLYFSWLGSIFGNFKSITANAIKMDWSTANETDT